ncbi:hypothetical protein BH24ACT15_BH24ACT15_05390 [soil metagenome]
MVSLRNPPWTADELILALDLYLRMGANSAGSRDVIELSGVLNALPIHTVRPDQEKFRNPNGVALKLANFQALDPSYSGVGMTRGGRGDARVWDRYHDRPAEVARIAAVLRAGAENREGFPVAQEEDEDAAEEGRLLYRRHRIRERDPRIVDRKKRAAEDLGCKVCGFDFERVYGRLGRGFIECHHIVPLSSTGVRQTTLADLVLVCSNCHRMAHRARPWPSVDELRDLVRPQLPS